MSNQQEGDIQLTQQEYLIKIIKEYHQALLRSLVYPKQKDKVYWSKICGYKRDKIYKISYGIGETNIFNDPDQDHKYYTKFYPKNEIPLLITEHQDLVNYYSQGATVFVEKDDKNLIGRIHSVDLDKKTCYVDVKVSGDVSVFPLGKIKRALDV